MADTRKCRIEADRLGSRVRMRVIIDGEQMLFGRHQKETSFAKSEALALCSRLRGSRRTKISLSFEIAGLRLLVRADDNVVIELEPQSGDWVVGIWVEEAEALADVIEGVAKADQSHGSGALNFLY